MIEIGSGGYVAENGKPYWVPRELRDFSFCFFVKERRDKQKTHEREYKWQKFLYT